MEQAEKRDTADYGEETEKSFYACSAQDCTGLIPSLPRDGGELEAYEELYPYIQDPVGKRREERIEKDKK